MADLYISPTGAGDKSGRDINNAAAIGSLNTLIGKAGAGGQVLLIADQGDYKVSTIIGINRGGAADQPVTIRGIDSAGNSMAAHIVGTRPADWAAGDAAGNELFKMGTGANHLEFRDLRIDNVGTAFRATADIADLTIEKVDAGNVRRFFEDYASASGGTATISGLLIRDVSVQGFSRSAIRLQYDTNNVLIENVRANGGGQIGDDLPVGIHLQGTVHNATLRQTVVENVQSVEGTYLNADGFATERGVYDVRFIDTVARGNTDGGYDLKSENTTLVRTLSEENGRNYRLWGSATLIDSVGLNPVWRGGSSEQNQLWLDTAAKVTVTGGMFKDAGSRTKVISSEGSLTLQDVAITRSELATLMTEASLAGLSGADTLVETIVVDQGESSAGADTYTPVTPPLPEPVANAMVGTGGDDIFLVDHAGDTISEAANSGRDRVETTLDSYTLGASLEDLLRLGDRDFFGTGNSAANTLTGSAGRDNLSGLDGNDTISGGAGADTLAGGNGEDMLNGGDDDDSLLGGWQSDTLNGGAGLDRLVGDVEWLNGTGAHDRLNGDDGDDLLIGDAVNIFSSGKGGSDRLAGGGGNDVLIGDADNMKDSGRGGADTLDGGDGNDWLYGDGRSWTVGVTGGIDRLNGGSGDDHLVGGGSADMFIFQLGSGADEISDYARAEGDRIDLSAFDIAFDQLSFANVAGGVRIELGTDSIFVRGVDSFVATDFIFG